MSETASGFVRVATLLLVSAVFAIVWRGDQHAQYQFVAARKQAAERAEMLAHGSAHQDAADQLDALAPASPRLVTPAPAFRLARVEIEMELPSEIAPGTYQVVDQSGQLQKIRVLTGEGPVQGQDLYVVDQRDGGRQYFIRITDDLEEAAVQTATGRSPRQR